MTTQVTQHIHILNQYEKFQKDFTLAFQERRYTDMNTLLQNCSEAVKYTASQLRFFEYIMEGTYKSQEERKFQKLAQLGKILENQNLKSFLVQTFKVIALLKLNASGTNGANDVLKQLFSAQEQGKSYTVFLDETIRGYTLRQQQDLVDDLQRIFAHYAKIKS